MSRSSYQLPTRGAGDLMDGELLSIAGSSVFRQSVEACPPRAVIQATLTRPADTTAYAAGDALTNSTSSPVAITFADVARYLGGGGIIKSAVILDSANQATRLSAELWLFRGAAAPTAQNDNSAFAPTDADLANLLGIIIFDGTAAANGFIGTVTAGAAGNVIILGKYSSSFNLDIPYVCDATKDDLYGLLVVRNAYTPVSAEIFTVSLLVERE